MKASGEELRLRGFAAQALKGETQTERELAASMLLYAALAHYRQAEAMWEAAEQARAELQAMAGEEAAGNYEEAP